MKKISVIIPVYNTGPFLYNCLDTLVNQTIGIDTLDIILVDDGSTDNSPEILKSYEERYPDSFRIITKKNGGQGSARNMAFPHVKGEYILLTDSDDFLDLQWCEKMYNKAADTGADFVICDYESAYVSSDGKDIKYKGDYNHREVCDNNRDIYIDFDVCLFTCLIKRDILEQSQARYPEGVIYEDTAFFVELLPWVTHPEYISEPLSKRTLREGSTMTNVKAERVAHIFGVFDYLINFYKDKNKYEEYHSELEYFICKVLKFSSINRIGFIKSWSDRRALVKRTSIYVKEHFPKMKKNKYIKKGLRGMYMKYSSRFVMNMVVELMRIKFLIRKDYNI